MYRLSFRFQRKRSHEAKRCLATTSYPAIPSGHKCALSRELRNDGKRNYVPLLDTAAGGPAIGVLDVAQGKVVEFLRPKEKIVFGNLVFAGEVMVSQSATVIRVFPLAEK
jgi:hypothetical protein